MATAPLLLFVSFISFFPFLFVAFLICSIIAVLSLSLFLAHTVSYPFFSHIPSKILRTSLLLSILVALITVISVHPSFHTSLNILLTDPVFSQPLYDFRTSQLREKRNTVNVVYPGGEVTGVSALSVETFRGIPFAQPPIDDFRLRPPRRIVENLGKRDATQLGPSCPQMILSSSGGNMVTNLLGELTSRHIFQKVVNAKEDCLTVNIQRPAGTNSTSRLPVICWIFGGAFEFGSNALYDASGLLKLSINLEEPVVYVGINYRMGGFGFLAGKEVLAERVANLGLLDQRLALEWIADNIQAFGGDPDRVTLWGESSGAISIFNQMALYQGNITYKGKSLFHGAIMNSGSVIPAQPVDSPKAQAIYNAVVTASNCQASNNTLDCLRRLPYDRFLKAANSVPCMASYNSVALSYLPRPNGTTLMQSPEALVYSGSYAAVPMIVGDQEDEGTIFSILQKNLTSTIAVAQYLKDLYFNNATLDQLAQLVDTYPKDPESGSPFRTGEANELYPGFKRLSAILGDLVFTLTRRLFLMEAKNNNPNVPAWSYMSSYGYGTPILGTFHSSDLAQVFYSIPPNYASRAMQTYFLNFINNGDPNIGAQGYMRWPRWGDSLQIANFFRDKANLLTDDFRQESCDFIRKNVMSLYV